MAGTRKKKPGRHKADCRCVNCNMRRKREREQLQNPTDPRIGEASSISPSSSTDLVNRDAAETFASASAGVVAAAGVQTDATPTTEGSGGVQELAPPQLLDLPYGMQIDISQQNIRAHWLPILSNALVAGFKNPEMGFAEWEIEIWAPALTGVTNRYLPDLLKLTDRPELAMLAAAMGSYVLARVKLIRAMMDAKKRAASSGAGTSTAGSPVAPPSSASPEPGKPSSALDSFVNAGESFGSTQ